MHPDINSVSRYWSSSLDIKGFQRDFLLSQPFINKPVVLQTKAFNQLLFPFIQDKTTIPTHTFHDVSLLSRLFFKPYSVLSTKAVQPVTICVLSRPLQPGKLVDLNVLISSRPHGAFCRHRNCMPNAFHACHLWYICLGHTSEYMYIKYHLWNH